MSAPGKAGARGGERQLFHQPVTSRVRPGHGLPGPRTGNRWTLLRPGWGWPRGGPGLGIRRRVVEWEGLGPEFPEALGGASGCSGTRRSMGSCCWVLKTVSSPSASLLGSRIRCYNERPPKRTALVRQDFHSLSHPSLTGQLGLVWLLVSAVFLCCVLLPSPKTDVLKLDVPNVPDVLLAAGQDPGSLKLHGGEKKMTS